MIPTALSPSVTRIDPTFISTIFVIASNTVADASILRTPPPFPRRISEMRAMAPTLTCDRPPPRRTLNGLPRCCAAALTGWSVVVEPAGECAAVPLLHRAVIRRVGCTHSAPPANRRVAPTDRSFGTPQGVEVRLEVPAVEV